MKRVWGLRIEKYKKYVKILGFTLFGLSDNKNIAYKTPKTFEQYREQKHHYKIIIDKYHKYIKPTVSPCRIITEYKRDQGIQKKLVRKGNPSCFPSYGFFNKFFSTEIQNDVPEDLPDSVQVYFRIKTEFLMRAGEPDRDIDKFTLYLMIPEQKALEDALFIYDKMNHYVYEADRLLDAYRNNEHITTFIRNGQSWTSKDNSLISFHYRTLFLVNLYIRLLVTSYHTFLDKFLKRIDYEYNKNSIQKSFTQTLKDICSDVNDAEFSNLLKQLDTYKKFRNTNTHGIAIQDFDLGDTKELKHKIRDTYEDVARYIWKKYEKTCYPKYIEQLNPYHNPLISSFLTNQETRVLVRQYAKMGFDRIDELREIIDETETGMKKMV